MAFFEICPKCGSNNTTRGRNQVEAVCLDCGFVSKVGEALPEPTRSDGVAFPDGLAPDFLPIFVAHLLHSFLQERDERMKVYIATEGSEGLARWAVAVALGELYAASGGVLPQPALMKFQENIERPTLGKWLDLLKTLCLNAPQKRLVAPNVFSLWETAFQPNFKTEKEGGALETSFLMLRNRIAHGGGLTLDLAKKLLGIYETRFLDLCRHVANATAGCDLVAVKDGKAVRLMGFAATPCDYPSVVPKDADGVYLYNATNAIPLHPIAEYGPILYVDVNGRLIEKPVQPAPQLYQRAELKRLQYLPLAENELISESRNLEAFRKFFRLETRPRAEVASAEGFAWNSFLKEARIIAEELIGRKAELQRLKEWIKAPERCRSDAPNIYWLQGGAGLGKSTLMAKLAADYAHDQHRGIYFHRFRAGDFRNSIRSFLRLLQSALWHWEPLKALTQAPTADAQEGDALRRDVKARLEQIKSLKPKRDNAPRPLFLVLMDGLDEVAQREPEIVQLINELAVEGALFLCAGRAEFGLAEAFEELRKRNRAEPSLLPPMSESDIREMLIEELSGASLGLLKLDRDKDGERVVNPFIEAVVKNADGLPLYVKLVIEDVKQGAIELSEKASLPRGLTEYYQNILKRLSISDVQRDVTLVVALLARAEEPLDEPALAQLLALSENADWQSDRQAFQARIENALRYGASLLRQAETKEGAKGYRLYHQSFRDFVGGMKDAKGNLQTPPAEMLKGTVRQAERLLARAAAQWQALSDREGERALRNHVFRWGTRYAVEWLGEEGAKQAKARLMDFDYLQARLKALPPDELYGLVSDYKLLLERFPDALRLLKVALRGLTNSDLSPDEFYDLVTLIGSGYFFDKSLLLETALRGLTNGDLSPDEFHYLVTLIDSGYFDDLRLWEAFFRERLHLLLHAREAWGAHKILLQLAVEHADNSPVTLAAERWLAEGKCDWVWMRRVSRPLEAEVSSCLYVLEGHAKGVNGAIELHDGRALSWSDDRTLRVWDLNSGRCAQVLEGHTDSIEGAIALRDGRALSWSFDNTLRLWDLERGACPQVLKGHSIAGAIALRDGRALSWSFDNTLRLWDLERGKCVQVLKGHTGSIRGAMELRDGRLLSWADDGTLRLWDLDSGEHIQAMEGHTGTIEGAMELRDGRALSWSKDKTLRLWDLDNGRCIQVLQGHNFAVKGAIELRDGRLLSWAPNELRVWDIKSGKCEVLQGHNFAVKGAIELRDGRLLLWLGDKTLQVLDAESGECLRILEGHTSWVEGAIELRDGRLLSWAQDKTLRLWNTMRGAQFSVWNRHVDYVSGMLELHDGHLLSWSRDGMLRVWNSKSGERLKLLQGHNSAVNGAIELRDGRLLSWAMNELRIWNIKSDKCKILEGHTDRVNGAIELRDGRALSWSRDKTLRLWNTKMEWLRDAKNGKCSQTFQGHASGVNGAVELRDGRALSWAMNELRIWDIKNGKCLQTFQGHTGETRGAKALRSGRILSWSFDKTLRVWDLDSGRCIQVLEGHTGSIEGAIELRDGRVLSWSSDDTLRVWDLESGTSVALTENDRARYPEVFREYDEHVAPDRITNRLRFEGKGLFKRETGESVCWWEPEADITVQIITKTGRCVAGLANGQVCVLQTYRGNAPISLDELDRLVAEGVV